MPVADQPSSEPVPHKLPVVIGSNAGPVEDFDTLLGEGSDLWADDAEFTAFLAELRRWRMQDRDQSRPQ